MASPRSIARAAARDNRRSGNRTRNIRTITGPVYVASPLGTYKTPQYGAMLERIAALMPQANILAARDLFASNADWRARWPGILRTLDALVFFDDRGSIGRGVYQEIQDAQAAGLPVLYLPHRAAGLLPYDGKTVVIVPHGRSWARYADVVYALTPDVLRACGAPAHVVERFAALVGEKGGA